MRVSGLAIAMAFAGAACSKGAPAADTSAVTAAPSSTQATVASATPVSGRTIKVYKDPNCGCCKEWIKHLEQNGFTVEVMDMPDLSAVKTKYGVNDNIKSCHTGVIGNYVVEGHVPADLIVKMLEEKPAIAGLAVPGMPMGSPGMEGASKEPYDVLTFDRAGHTEVYAHR
ncbi:MAG TPA: DUF411 domain-containing protein [Gemmatimonadaceae bacterium]